MKQSQLFGKTTRSDPQDEASLNARFLERGGFIYKTMSGVYDYLPLGWRVFKKIENIIREEMNALGGQEIFMSALQPKERWDKTDRWESLGKENMYQFKDRVGRDLGLAVTHEEAVAEIASRSVFSYKDLPLAVYQFQTKFRDELRSKSGIIRGREFIMKDLYSFHKDNNDLELFYGKADKSYRKIFSRCGFKTLFTEASGGSFTTQLTHEYQVLSGAGEDWVLFCPSCEFAQNEEISSLEEGARCPKCRGTIKREKGIEVGNIFKLGTRFSEPLGLYYTSEKGDKIPVVMGSYGIGLGRLLGAAAEVHNDERGLIWPDNIAPFKVHLVLIFPKEKNARNKVKKEADRVYMSLLARGIEVLYDDRAEKTAGEKFVDADLIGIPWRAVISENTVAKKAIEIKKRKSKKSSLAPLQKLEQIMSAK